MRLDKGDFLGREALVAAKAKPPTKRCVSLVAGEADAPLAHGGELVLRDGRPVGEVTSAGFGATLDRVVALAYVSSPDGAIDAGWLESGRFELDIAGVRVAVRASLKAPYDPSSARTRTCNRDRLAAHNSPHAEVPPRSGGLEARSGGEALHRQGCVLRGSPPARTSG